MPFGLKAFYFFNHLPHSPALDSFSVVVHRLASGGLIFFSIVLLLLVSSNLRCRILGFEALLAIGSTWATTDLLLKKWIRRPRPFQVLPDVWFIPPAPHNDSFPSGETATAFAVAAIWILLFPKNVFGYLLLGFAFLIGLDRLYMGHHYLSDTLAGAVIGAGWSLIVFLLCKKSEDRLLALAVKLPPKPRGTAKS